MEDDNLTKAQEYKKQFFSKTDTFFSKKPKYIYHELQDTTAILSSIASNSKFSQIRQRYKTKIFLSKILLKSHIHWILYSFYRNDTLYIATSNHIGQNEINLQKLTILKYCKQSKDYNFINKVSVFRDEEFYKDEKKEKKEIALEKIHFKERSYAIFENYIKDTKQNNIIKRIREDIIVNRADSKLS